MSNELFRRGLSVCFSWYHTSITGVQAESLLKSEGKHGSFLFRPSESVSGSYCLSVRSDICWQCTGWAKK